MNHYYFVIKPDRHHADSTARTFRTPATNFEDALIICRAEARKVWNKSNVCVLRGGST